MVMEIIVAILMLAMAWDIFLGDDIIKKFKKVKQPKDEE